MVGREAKSSSSSKSVRQKGPSESITGMNLDVEVMLRQDNWTRNTHSVALRIACREQ